MTFWKRKLNDYPLLPTIAKSGFTLEVGPLPWGTAIGGLYLKTLKVLWQVLDAVEARNRMIENQIEQLNASNSNNFELISVDATFFQAAECNPVNYPLSPRQHAQNNILSIKAMIHPEFQSMDYSKELTNETKIFIGLDGEKEYKFDRESMTSGEDEEVRKEKSFYPFFINEAAYYEKEIAFCIAYKIRKEVLVAIRK